MLNPNLDLFGQVIVTHQDVKDYLDTIPNMGATRRKSAVEKYLIDYNVANKLILLKSDGSFTKLITQLNDDREYRENAFDDLAPLRTKYKEPWLRMPCPPYSHTCGFMDCEIFVKRHKSAVNHKYYAAKKLKKEKAAKAALKAILKNNKINTIKG
jgi:hypothetical protein